MPKCKPRSENISDPKYYIETPSKTRAKADAVAKKLTSEMSATATVPDTQVCQIPAESVEFNTVVLIRQIQQDRADKPQ